MDTTIGELVINVIMKTDSSGFSKLKAQLDSMKKDVDSAKDSISNLGPVAKKALGVVAAAFSINTIKNFANECVNMASDVEQMQQKFDVVYGNSAEAAEKWAQDFADSAGRNVNTIKKYMSDAQNLLYGFASSYIDTGEMTEDEARAFGAEMSENMTSLAMDIASFANMDEDTAINAMTKAVQGETECAKTLGAVLTDTTRAQAMQKLGIEGTYDSLDQLTKMQVNYQAILQQSPDAVGDLDRSNAEGLYESRARMTQARMEELKEFIGTQLLPAYQYLQAVMYDVYNTLLKLAKALLENEDGTNRVEIALKAVKTVLNFLMGPLRLLFSWIGKIADAMGGWNNMIGVLAASFGIMIVAMNWGKIVKGINMVGTAVNKLHKIFTLKFGAMILVIAMVILVIQDFVTFMQGGDSVIGDWFESMGIDAHKAQRDIYSTFRRIKSFFHTFVHNLKTTFKFDDLMSNLKGFVKSILEVIALIFNKDPSEFLESVKEHIKGLFKLEGAANLGQTIGNVLNTVVGLLGRLAKFISNNKEVIAGLAKAVLVGVVAFKTFKTALGVVTTIQKAKDKLKDFKKIASGTFAIMKGAITVNPVILAIIATIILLVAVGVKLYQNWDKIQATATKVWNVVVGAFTAMGTAVQTIFKAIGNAIKALIKRVKSIPKAIKKHFKTAIKFLKSLPKKALKWGKDFIEGFINGIKEKVQGVKDAISGVADNIKSVIHFSRPDEGPLRDYEEWMPDMMEGLASGIDNNSEVVIGKVRAMAQEMQLLMQSASASAASMISTVNNTKSVTQNVSISNSYSGAATETAKKITGTMKKSSVDATTQMARALQYARA